MELWRWNTLTKHEISIVIFVDMLLQSKLFHIDIITYTITGTMPIESSKGHFRTALPFI